jgi:hypothetical protein
MRCDRLSRWKLARCDPSAVLGAGYNRQTLHARIPSAHPSPGLSVPAYDMDLASKLDLNRTVSPPDTACWLDFTDGFAADLNSANNECKYLGFANVTDSMIDFLNLKTFDNYFQAYCASIVFFIHFMRGRLSPGNNPDPNDSCPFNYCPNVRLTSS